jgi:hypothetical protein
MSLDGIPGVVSSATTSVSNAGSAVNSLISSGPASALSGIVDSATGAINSAITGIGSLLSGAFGAVPAGFKLPLPNPLHDYASYNYIFSLTCLDANSFNFPGSSYLVGKLPPLILKSGNGSPSNRIRLPDGQFDFFMDNVVITGQYGFEKGTGNTNSTNIEFQVTEPYSMGMFMTACQTAAYQMGYSNYNEAPFLLVIEFRGNTETGVMSNVPNTTKYIPFHLNNISMKVNGAGSIYNIVGVICNAVGLRDSYNTLKPDVSISGKTVQEILQSSPKSLQQVVNDQLKAQQTIDKTVAIADEILILFPTDTSTLGTTSILSTGAVETPSSATTSSTAVQINDPKLFQKLGVSRSANSTNSTLIQKDGDINALGKAKLGFDVTRGGKSSFAEDAKVYDTQTNTWSASLNKTTPGLVDFTFKQSSDIINAINQVLIKSQAATDALDPKFLSKEGMRPWWRIDVQTYHIASNANMKVTGQVPKLIVYRVVPYLVHASRLMAPNAAAPGIPQLTKQAAKVYNYIYTGKNVDLLKFEIDISNTFYQVFMADAGKRNDGTITAAQSGGTDIDKKTQGDTPTAVGGSPTKPGDTPTQAKAVATTTSTDNKGGSRGETEGTRAARLFHDALIKGYDMMNITFDIAGDPYYIANSGAGNYTATSTNLINVDKDKNINYQNGEVDVVINFRTPTDINQATGLYNLTSTKLSPQFSGLYKLTTIISTFKGGVFQQTITGNRRQGQDSKASPNPASLISSVQSVTQPDLSGTVKNSDGSTTQTMDDGSTLTTSATGVVSSTPAPTQ